MDLIIIRGNSGSGKTTIARALHNELGEDALLLSQDVVRREMLQVHDRPGNLAISLIQQIALYGIKHCKYVIIEGIFNKQKYNNMLQSLISLPEVNAHIYYFDLPFEETVCRHNTKGDTDFGEEKMRSWFVAHDYLGNPQEKMLNEFMNQEKILAKIIRELKKA
ncbi:kinase [Staphylococcus sp. 18_1_E_LY]|uniref:Kinase n=1 Tax=Staphylococcus lloydii TaxID=2781774 RepID=A0A7T1AZD5_9STAP|nr:AAA family ATPase [Staphylococcus lloydii]MBF7019510.1 kinase [Staphylococcus lloydii]MBF7027237.1 kinase [Staphylococcus lloydii]QPM74877.1 kinase [Staphylococcus lloydii]